MNITRSCRVFVALTVLLVSCATLQSPPASPAVPSPAPSLDPSTGLSAEQAATLSSLEQVDDYPLYRMDYVGPYPHPAHAPGTVGLPMLAVLPARDACPSAWGCSLFAALGDEKNRLYGRNFDWQFSPALLLFTDPPDGYASVSMVDIEYLGFAGDRSRDLTDLPLQDRKALLRAPSLPFDGMNEKGLVVGMAAVPPGDMPIDPRLKTLDELEVIREILDHAATVEEAIEILVSYNIDMGSVPIHYLVASASGESVLVEFHEGEMVVFRNDSAWQAATNFLLASTHEDPRGQCWRYDLITRRLEELAGRISSRDALRLLADVSQENTQWSVLYHMTSGDLVIVMGRNYSGTLHRFHLDGLDP